MNPLELLEEDLNSFDCEERQAALRKLQEKYLRNCPEPGGNVNMHFHSFFSYNAEGWSPSRIAWEARKKGLYAAGLCDFDVLDGIEEFIEAGLALGLRTAVNVETRAYVGEMADKEISSPGEPGVTYIMGAGFPGELDEGSVQARELDGYRQRARERNEALLRRVNAHLKGVAIDYETDVLPLTPAGNATERHIISAYVNKVKAVYQKPDAVAGFWAKLLGLDYEEAVVLMGDTPSLEEKVRSKLVKKGGVGYEQPSSTTFPPAEVFTKWVKACDAIPMITWLDGTSSGEKDARGLLDLLRKKGCEALNIIPDRNWNIKDPASRATKQANLKAIVESAESLDLPINVGTEMNKLGLPFTDDLGGEALKAYAPAFLKGARIMVGQTILARYADAPYVGAKVKATFATVRDRNKFFEAVGGLPPLTLERAVELESMGPEKTWEFFANKIISLPDGRICH